MELKRKSHISNHIQAVSTTCFIGLKTTYRLIKETITREERLKGTEKYFLILSLLDTQIGVLNCVLISTQEKQKRWRKTSEQFFSKKNQVVHE